MFALKLVNKQKKCLLGEESVLIVKKYCKYCLVADYLEGNNLNALYLLVSEFVPSSDKNKEKVLDEIISLGNGAKIMAENLRKGRLAFHN